MKRWLFALAGLLPPNFVVVVPSILTSAAIPAKTNTKAKPLTKRVKQEITSPEAVTPQTIIDRIKANPKGAVGYSLTYVGKQYSIADLLEDLEALKK